MTQRQYCLNRREEKMNDANDLTSIPELLVDHYESVEMEAGFKQRLLERTRSVAAVDRGKPRDSNQIIRLFRRRRRDRRSH